MDGLDAEQREELQEEWNSYAKGKQRLNAKDLQGLMRQLGTIQTDAETMEMIREAGGADGLDYNQFMAWIGRKQGSDAAADDLIRSFQVFDKDGKGYVSISELRFVLTCLGDKLDDELVDAMLNQADPSGCGSVQYESFVRNMLSRGA